MKRLTYKESGVDIEKADTFLERWRNCARHEVKEAAPPQGLCLLRVGYPDPVFPKATWYDCQPRYLLQFSDSPDSPIGAGET